MCGQLKMCVNHVGRINMPKPSLLFIEVLNLVILWLDNHISIKVSNGLLFMDLCICLGFSKVIVIFYNVKHNKKIPGRKLSSRKDVHIDLYVTKMSELMHLSGISKTLF